MIPGITLKEPEEKHNIAVMMIDVVFVSDENGVEVVFSIKKNSVDTLFQVVIKVLQWAFPYTQDIYCDKCRFYAVYKAHPSDRY